MSIFKRLKTITMAEINQVLDKLEDPIVMLNEYSREMEDEIAKGQNALSRQIFVEKKQASLIAETEELLAKITRQAKLAVERGDDEMAKLAVQEKLVHQKQLDLYKEQFDAILAQTQKLEEKLQELQETYKQLQHKKVLLASRANVAQSIKQIEKSTVSFQTDTIARGFARAEERIMMMEAEAQAVTQGSSPLLARESFVDDEELQQELEKLRAEME